MTADRTRLEHAAAARREQVSQRADKPSKRHSADAPDTKRTPVAVRAQLRAADAAAGLVHFTGLASAYEQPYEMFDFFGPYTEVVSAGAASKTLARADLDVTLVLGHDQMRRIARTTNSTLTLTETAAGLEVDAPALDLEDRDVSYIVPKIRAELIDEMSFAFKIVRGSWSPDYTEYRIEEFDLHRGDVSIVGYGANPYTTSSIRAAGRDLVTLEDTRLLPLV